MIDTIISVLVNWNLKDDTVECISSLSEAGAPLDQIVVVDNHSQDGSVDAVRNRFGGSIHIIESPKNLGFAGGVNLGIEPALALGADWIFLLNNDTKVSPTIFTALRESILAHPEFSILGPVIYYYAEPETVWFYGDTLFGSTLLTRPIIKDSPFPPNIPEFQEVDFVSGCGLLVRREVFEEVGLFDAGLFMYGEEVDFLWRSRQAGYRSGVCRDATMWHKVSKSANRDKPTTRYYRVRNQNRFYRRYAIGINLVFMFLFSIFKIVVSGLEDILRRDLNLVAPMIRGWFEGWFQKTEPLR